MLHKYLKYKEKYINLKKNGGAQANTPPNETVAIGLAEGNPIELAYFKNPEYSKSEIINYFRDINSRVIRRIINSPSEIKKKRDFKRLDMESPKPIICFNETMVPKCYVEHILKSKINRINSIGSKYVADSAITNMEAVLNTWIVPLYAINKTADSQDIVPPFNVVTFQNNSARQTIMSASIQPDFEVIDGSSIFMNIVELKAEKTLGELLTLPIIIPSNDNKNIDVIRTAYDENIRKHIIYNLISDHNLPSIAEARADQNYMIMTVNDCKELLYDTIVHAQAHEYVVVKNKFIEFNGKLLSVEALFNTYVLQLTIELSGLNSILLQGYIYTIDADDRFTTGFDKYLMILFKLVALKYLYAIDRQMFSNMKCISVNTLLFPNNPDNSNIINRLNVIFNVPNAISVVEYSRLFKINNPNRGVYIGCQLDAGFALVEHNNFDGFGVCDLANNQIIPLNKHHLYDLYSNIYSSIVSLKYNLYLNYSYEPLKLNNNQQILKDHLILMKHILDNNNHDEQNPLFINYFNDFNDKFEYAVWINTNFWLPNGNMSNAIYIQLKNNLYRADNAPNDDTKINIVVDDTGTIRQINFEGHSQDDDIRVKQYYIPIINKIIKVMYEKSSSYAISMRAGSEIISVGLIPEGIKIIPEYHVLKICEYIKKNIKNFDGRRYGSYTHLTYLNHDLTPKAGIDASGLRREYYSRIIQYILESKLLMFEIDENSQLYLPRSINRTSLENINMGNNISPLNKTEYNLYYAIGVIMMYCYNIYSTGAHISVGYFFNEIIYKIIFNLTYDEIQKNLSFETKIKMIGFFLDAEININLNKFINDKKNLNTDEAKEAFIELGGLLGGMVDNDDDPLNQRVEEIYKYVLDNLFDSFGHKLLPIHAIAQGMLSCTCINQNIGQVYNDQVARTRWITICSDITVNTQIIIQGSIDKDVIKNNIVEREMFGANNTQIEIMRKKMRWFREYIDGLNIMNTRKLLIWISGSASIPNEIKINKHIERDTHFEAHTCFSSIDIPVKITGIAEPNASEIARIYQDTDYNPYFRPPDFLRNKNDWFELLNKEINDAEITAN